MTTSVARTIDAFLSPAELEMGRKRGFAGATCVVIDVLRATSVMVTGLANGAHGYLPVEDIAEAIALHRGHPHYLLGGERDGLRITAHQSGGVEFHLGNSPREHSRARVENQTIITTTTNGTRALKACAGANTILAGSFLNLSATANWLLTNKVENIVLVCAGTGDTLGLEDVLAAGAFCDALSVDGCEWDLSDSARVAMGCFRASDGHVASAVNRARNARRLLSNPELRGDVEFCLRVDSIQVVAAMASDGVIRRLA